MEKGKGDEFNSQVSLASHVVPVDVNSRKGTLVLSVYDMCSSVLNLGILALPAAFAMVGVVVGAVLLFLAGLAASFQFYMLSYCGAHTTQPASYQTIALDTLHHGDYLVNFILGLKGMGGAVSFFVILGNLIPVIVGGLGAHTGFLPASPVDQQMQLAQQGAFPTGHLSNLTLLDSNFWMTMMIFILLPLCFIQHHLRRISIIAMTALSFLIVVVLYYAFSASLGTSGFSYAIPSAHFFTAVPIYIYAFGGQTKILSVQDSLADYSVRRMKTIIFITMVIGLFLYQSVGILGYLVVGPSVNGNVFVSFSSGVLLTIGSFAIVISVIFSFPGTIGPMRAFVEQVAHGHTNSDQYDYSKWYQKFRYAFVTMVLVVISFGIATCVSSLEAVNGFVGGTLSTIIDYILPSLFYYCLKKHEYNEAKINTSETNPQLKFWSCSVVGAVLMMVLGCLITVTYVIQIVASYVTLGFI